MAMWKLLKYANSVIIIMPKVQKIPNKYIFISNWLQANMFGNQIPLRNSTASSSTRLSN